VNRHFADMESIKFAIYSVAGNHPTAGVDNWRMSDDILPPLITTAIGRYRHYKGMEYEVVGTVRHSETLEPLTLYRALYGEHGLWVRPAAMFNEDVVIDGVQQPRFRKIS
jgi:hypothetical protein